MTKINYFVRSIALVAMLALVVPGAKAQSARATGTAFQYYYPLINGIPLYSGQPSDVAEAYLWMDELSRSTSRGLISNYIQNLTWGDTAKFLASILYKAIDDNPMSPILWNMPFGVYKSDPSYDRNAFQNHIFKICVDTARTGYLLSSDIIADITIHDTEIESPNPGTQALTDVLVNATVIDRIKGHYIPSVPNMTAKKKTSETPLGVSIPIYPCVPTLDTLGIPLIFQYCPAWPRRWDRDVAKGPSLMDSTGWWIRPDSEYIVFLRLDGLGLDSTYFKSIHGSGSFDSLGYFTIFPLWGTFGTNAGMYPVHHGIVQDPYDDFGIGAAGGLTVAEWKSRLRAKINSIVNP